ncbi:MAG: M48 family metalloprotease, partial [Parachlamydiaceae bacterium]
LLVGGLLSYFAGKILSSMISREREYLADASAVQFTRNPDGLIGALRKIQKEATRTHMPKMGLAYNHLYFDHYTLSSLFATHPPIEKRIAALEGKNP